MYLGVWVKKSGNTIHYYDFGKFRLDVTNRELLKDGLHVPLTQKSFELLEFLIQNRGRGLKKNEILNGIWTESFVEEANLAQHIYMVRKALKDNGDSVNYIETIPKYGYRFIGEVSEELVDISLPAPQTIHTTADTNGFTPAPVEPGPQSVPDNLPEAEPRQRAANFSLPKWVVGLSVLAAVVVAAVYYAFLSTSSGPVNSQIDSIAILPFSQIGDNPDQKLGLGIADTLISKLGNQDEITVSPTSTIIKYIEKGTDNPIEIGEELGVDAVLTGTIQRENETVRVNVQLISVKEKTPRWSDKFDAEFSDIFSLQDKVAEQVASRLAIKLSNPQTTETANKFTDNIEAYQAYTLGLFYWDKRSEENLPKAIEYFESAIEKDPKFATAHALAADAYSLMAVFKFSSIPETKAIAKARELANKALTLDPNSSEAHTALGVVAIYEKNAQEAKRLYRKAIELKPNNATAHQRLAWMLTTNETLDEAIAEMRLAQKADPISVVTNLNLTRLLRLDRKPHEAMIYCKRALEMEPKSVSGRLYKAEISEQLRDYKTATGVLKEVVSESEEDTASKLILSRVYAKSGNIQKAKKMLAEIKASPDEGYSYEFATAHWAIGNESRAIDILKNSKENSLIYYLHIKFDPSLDGIRQRPEYPQILSDVSQRLDSAYR